MVHLPNNGIKDSEKTVSPNYENNEGIKTTNAVLNQLLEDLNALDNNTYSKAIEKIILSHDVKIDKNIPASKWTLSNILLMSSQFNESGISCFDGRGRRQWEQAKRTVKAAAKPIYILAPVMTKFCIQCSKEKNRNVTMSYNYSLKTVTCVYCKQTRDQLKQKGLYKEMFNHKFTPIKLFSIDSTTNGQAAEKKVQTQIKRKELKLVVEKLNLKIDYHYIPKAFGYYNNRTLEIRLSTKQEQVFFHEIAHAIHDHLKKTDKAQKRSYSQGEVIAELSAVCIARMYGLEWIGHAKEYLKLYLKTKDNEKLSQVAQSLINDIGQILDFIF